MENQFCNPASVFASLSPISDRYIDKALDAKLQFNFAFLFLNNSGYNQTRFTFLYLSIPYHFSRHYNSGKLIFIIFCVLSILQSHEILKLHLVARLYRAERRNSVQYEVIGGPIFNFKQYENQILHSKPRSTV